jgi:hypothetical protein
MTRILMTRRLEPESHRKLQYSGKTVGTDFLESAKVARA